MWHGVEGMGWGWIGLGVAHMVVFWTLVIVVFLALVRWLGGGGVRAIDILKARYAKGELTREQFERLKQQIGEGA
jgi:putative membrane protein